MVLKRYLTQLNVIRPKRRTAPGARPGVINVDPEAPPPKIHVISYDGKSLEEHTISDVAEIESHLSDDRVTWINVDGLGNAKTIKALGKLFNLHPLALEDVVNTHQRAKLEDYHDHLFIVLRMVALTDRLETEQVSLFLGPNFVLTFQEHVGDCFEPVRDRLRKNLGRIRPLKADYLAYALVDAVIDSYYPIMEEYGERLEVLEEVIYNNPQPNSFVSIHHIKKDLFLLRKTIWPHREMAGALARNEHDLITEDTQTFARDCYDHVVHQLDLAETFRELVSDLRDFYLTTLSNRTNEIMKVLTIIASVFIPATFIAGLYGMNFDHTVSPYNMPELHWVYGYPMALGLMVLCVFASLMFYQYQGWIRVMRWPRLPWLKRRKEPRK